MSCGVGGRRGLDPALLWPWHRPATKAPIRPLAWEPSDAAGKKAKRPKEKKKKKDSLFTFCPHVKCKFQFIH